MAVNGYDSGEDYAMIEIYMALFCVGKKNKNSGGQLEEEIRVQNRRQMKNSLRLN